MKGDFDWVIINKGMQYTHSLIFLFFLYMFPFSFLFNFPYLLVNCCFKMHHLILHEGCDAEEC